MTRPEGTEAVCLTGGSTLGIAGCTGVASGLYERRGSDPLTLRMVTGGVIYDFTAPERSGVYPDAELGRRFYPDPAKTGVSRTGATWSPARSRR
jgi:hypothetical protein